MAKVSFNIKQLNFAPSLQNQSVIRKTLLEQIEAKPNYNGHSDTLSILGQRHRPSSGIYFKPSAFDSLRMPRAHFCLKGTTLTPFEIVNTRIGEIKGTRVTFDLDDSKKQLMFQSINFSEKTKAYDQMMYDQFFTINTDALELCIAPLKPQIDQMRILDIGAGTGMISHAILKYTNPKELILYEIDQRIKIDPPNNYSNMVFLNKSFLFDQLAKTELTTGIIANPPPCLLKSLLEFIEKQQIRDVILIIPAEKLRLFTHDYQVIDNMNDKDFFPFASSENNSYLIIRKGFEPEQKVLAYNYINIGRTRLTVEEAIKHAMTLTYLSPGIRQQAADLLGGNTFDTIHEVIETLRIKEQNQTGAEFKRNIELSPFELEVFYDKHRKSLPQSELDSLENAICENRFSNLALSILNHLQKHDRVVLGQRYLMDRYLENGAIQQKELLNIPSDSWNWRLNEFWISAAAQLGKKVNIFCDQIAPVMGLINSQADVLDRKLTSNIVPLWHHEFDRPTLLAREISLLSNLNYRFEIKYDSKYKIDLIEALPAAPSNIQENEKI